MQNCQDTFSATFTSYNELFGYQQQVSSRSQWSHCAVNQLHVEPLNHNSSCYPALKEFATGVSSEAVEDSFNNLGLAIRFDQKLYPVRETAYKSLLDRAKVSGSGLNKLTKTELAQVLNTFLSHFRSEALVLVRDEKISAVHSGDESDYAILPIDLLLGTLQAKLDERFPGNVFDAGYSDHAITSASWELPDQKDDLIGTYTKLLDAKGKSAMASRLTPGIRFLTSDTGIASAKVSALLIGSQHPIHIGSCVAVDHRHKSSIADFDAALDQLFAQFGESMSRLQHLLEVELDYPVNAMTRVCKKLSMPKKAAVEAIAMYEMTYGGGAATAHDVFLAMQEIPFIMETSGAPESKLLALEENMARALTLNWNEYDLAKAVKSGNRVYDDTYMYQHADHPYALADFDRRFERASDGEPGILECKSTTYRHAPDWDDGGFPLYYEMQLRFYLSVADVNIGAFSAVWGNNPDNDIATPEITRDMAKEDMIFEKLDQWIWSLKHDKPPTMSGIPSKLALESLARIYQASDPTLPPVELPKKCEPSLRKILSLQKDIDACQAEIKRYEEQMKAHTVRIAELMKEHEHGVLETTTDKLLIDFVTKSSRRVSSTELKKKYPLIYDEVVSTSNSRKLRVSAEAK